MPNHDGCYYCGSLKDEFLKSVRRKVIYKSGNSGTMAVALCTVCIKADVIDLRVAVPQEA